jgi:SAM-dependent methyltransferase
MSFKLWQLGSPGSLLYYVYDGLRKRLNRRLADHLLDKGLDGSDGIILEAGSGPGFGSSLLACDARVKLSIALDIDFEALRHAEKSTGRLALVVGDLSCLPFRDDSVDLVWNSSTIEHLDYPEDAIVEMRRVVKNGSCAFIGAPNKNGPLGFEAWIKGSATANWIGNTFTAAKLKKIMQERGMTHECTIFYFFRFFVGVTARKDI